MASKAATQEAPVQENAGSVVEFDDQRFALSTERPDYMQGEGRGNENVAAEDIQIPRLEIIQDLSPILKSNPDAEVGQLFNSVTGEIYGNRVLFVPVMFLKQWLVWKDRKAGSGFRGAFSSEQDAKDRIMEAVDEGENAKNLTIAETPTHLGYILSGSIQNPMVSQIAISMPRSKIKISKRLNAMVQMAGGDRFSRVYEVRVNPETSPQGTFFNFDFVPKCWTPHTVYAKAEALHNDLNGHTIIIAHDTAEQDSEGAIDS